MLYYTLFYFGNKKIARICDHSKGIFIFWHDGVDIPPRQEAEQGVYPSTFHEKVMSCIEIPGGKPNPTVFR
jgi:hypothetical protein